MAGLLFLTIIEKKQYMKKSVLYSLLLVIFIAASAFVLTRFTKTSKHTIYSELLPRKLQLTYAGEWTAIKNNADVFMKNIDKNPSDVKSLLALTALYIQEGRNTGNLNYYNEAALKCIDFVLEKDKKNFEALSFKSTILLSQHRFAEGLAIAKELQQLYPYNAYVYGLLVDGYVESGKYKEAVEAADKMISIRPDNRSYSRIAYLREIHGDIPGAIEAMKMAVDAGAPGDENTEWCRVQLGKLFEKTGKRDEAKMLYAIANDNRHNYPYALAGLAGISFEEKNYDEALKLYMQADSLISDHTFKEGIAEVYEATGQPEKSRQVAERILKQMEQLTSGNKAGQNEDHEMAHAYMGVNDLKKALEYALKEYNSRPTNIEVNETVAIVYYEMGEYAKAVPYIEAALITDCKSPELLCHAGLLYARVGDKEKAMMYLELGLKGDPVISMGLKEESKKMLMSLN